MYFSSFFCFWQPAEITATNESKNNKAKIHTWLTPTANCQLTWHSFSKGEDYVKLCANWIETQATQVKVPEYEYEYLVYCILYLGIRACLYRIDCLLLIVQFQYQSTLINAVRSGDTDHCKNLAMPRPLFKRSTDSHSKWIFSGVFSTNCHICDGNSSSVFRVSGAKIRKLVRPLWLCKSH